MTDVANFMQRQRKVYTVKGKPTQYRCVHFIWTRSSTTVSRPSPVRVRQRCAFHMSGLNIGLEMLRAAYMGLDYVPSSGTGVFLGYGAFLWTILNRNISSFKYASILLASIFMNSFEGLPK